MTKLATLTDIMKTYKFSAGGLDFGNFSATTQAEAQEAFAADLAFKSWGAMLALAEEYGGNNVEIFEVLKNDQLIRVGAV